MQRSECIGTMRPCMRFSCKHNLTTELFELDEIETRIKTNTLRKSDFKYGTNCVLDLTDQFQEGMSNHEIAGVLNVSYETVRLCLLKGMTEMRGQMKSFSTINVNKLHEFLRLNFSPHNEDIKLCIEEFPTLTYKEMCLHAKSSGVLEELEFPDDDFEKLLNPELLDEDDEFIETYNLQSIPMQYERSIIGKMLGFSGSIIRIWMNDGLPFTIGRNGETLIDRADVLRHINDQGQHIYRILHVKNIPQDIYTELRLDLLQEVNET